MNISDTEIVQSLNLAMALNLIVNSRTVNGQLYVYDAAGYSKLWTSFISDYPLERLQAMAARRSTQS